MKKSTLALALCFTLGSSFANAAGGGGGGGGGSAGGARSRKFCWRFTGLIDRRNVVDGRLDANFLCRFPAFAAVVGSFLPVVLMLAWRASIRLTTLPFDGVATFATGSPFFFFSRRSCNAAS
jgi:hypothetical protein